MSEENKPKFKVDLIQPNKVTNARYDYTACQENVLTCIVGAIQNHMTAEKVIETDLFGNPTVTIDAGEVAKGNTKHYVIQELKKLRKKDIDFEWTNEKGEIEEVSTTLIGAIRSVKSKDSIQVEVSKWAIPYLIYYGKGVGGTIFSKSLALTLKSVYAKRIYKLLKQWEDKGGVPPMLLDDFRQMMGIEKKYPRPRQIEDRVLTPAKNELDRTGDITFEYSLSKIKSRSYNYINIKIFGSKKGPSEDPRKWYQFVYAFLCLTYPNHKNDKAMVITDKIQDSGQMRPAYNKFKRIDDDFTSGKKTNEDVIKITKYILNEDFGIK